MDSITHIVLGATIGEALAGKKLGKRALLLGAVAQSLPDIDFLASFWLDTSRDVWVHRGITHSFLFVLVLTPLLTLIAQRSMSIGWRGARSGASPMTRRDWWIFFSLQLFVHIFIDAFNAYGTGWFEPFSSYRVSFNVLFVADPFYSCWLGISFLALLILKSGSPARKKWVRFGLLLSSAYLCYCLGNKWWVDTRVERDLRQQGIRYDRYFTTPTPLNSWLWYVVAVVSEPEAKDTTEKEQGKYPSAAKGRNEEERGTISADVRRRRSAGYHIGYRSVFDSRSDPFVWAPRNDSLLQPFRRRGDVQYLLRFAGGYYTVEQWKGEGKDSLVFNVLRFGEMRGWEDTRAHFVFHYFLQYPGDNALVVQRGRFAGWNRESLQAFIRRIRGN